jgi:acyl-CoA oxidase
MPPNAPSGIPIVAVVFARLFVLSQDHGIKPFIVHMHDGFTMTNGITTRYFCNIVQVSFDERGPRLLTPRGGSGAVKHSVTQFQNVHLPATALLGHTTRAVDQKAAFFGNISRVVTGTLCMGTFSLSALRISANVAAKYSMRRVVTDATTGSMVPIFSFITQSLPVMTAIAQAQVLSAYANATHAIFTNEKTPHDVRHLVAAVFKVTTTRMASATLRILEDRCGAQGLFGVNQIFANHVCWA